MAHLSMAEAVVRRLLEMNPYDIDDPLDRPEYPAGFTAVLRDSNCDERAEMRHDAKTNRYRFTRSYYDPGIIIFDGDRDTGKRGKRVSAPGGAHYVRISQAETWLQQKAQEFTDAGWDVTML